MTRLKGLITASLLLGQVWLCVAQDDTSRTKVYRLATSLTYTWDHGTPAFFQEYTLNVNLSHQFHPRWVVGVAGLNIWSKGAAQQWEHHLLVGAFGQVNLIHTSFLRLYPELGVYRGNYCTCGQADPYKIPFRWYRSVGAGMSLKIASHFYLELGFYGYQIIGDMPGKYGYTQYVMGVEWQLE